jgi:nitric oxide reductase large subunit
MATYRWPIMFFLAVSFWNIVGAGLFGFLISTPLALYYMQGLNLTPLHGHTALLGVYGMVGTMLHQHPFVHLRLTAKVIFLIADIVLGSYALKWGATKQSRAFYLIAALLTYLLIAAIALTRGSPGNLFR